jgi:RsiW-degrading membrane proteinase PrsW (M82 family)
MLNSLVSLGVSLLPVLVFLLALVLLDSFKLVRFESLIAAILAGSITALACLWINVGAMRTLDIPTREYARYVAPVTEELLKAVYLIILLKRKRIGFMVDASIYGFAIGAGFAIVENIYYFRSVTESSVLLWVIRGFGTAIMHGGATAIVGIVGKSLLHRHPGNYAALIPGLVIAIAFHSVFNHFVLSPLLSTIAILVILPLLVAVVFRVSEQRTRRWLGIRFDTDQELLEMIGTGKISESRVGRYFEMLRSRFPGEVVVDMVCMLRLHLELSIRAKGVLLMREAGFDPPPEPAIEARLKELKYLEKSIGPTGQLAVTPILNMSDRELWQLNMLGKR